MNCVKNLGCKVTEKNGSHKFNVYTNKMNKTVTVTLYHVTPSFYLPNSNENFPYEYYITKLNNPPSMNVEYYRDQIIFGSITNGSGNIPININRSFTLKPEESFNIWVVGRHQDDFYAYIILEYTISE